MFWPKSIVESVCRYYGKVIVVRLFINIHVYRNTGRDVIEILAHVQTSLKACPRTVALAGNESLSRLKVTNRNSTLRRLPVAPTDI